ncbi:unnamed protein product [Ixodes hexagonus]
MGRRLNLSHLSQEECDRILAVIQRDLELRAREKERLGKLEEELHCKAKGKAQQHRDEPREGGKSCALCSAAFNLLFNRKLACRECGLCVCRDCAAYDSRDRAWYCRLCDQQRHRRCFSLSDRSLRAQSCEWFYDNVKVKFNHFGSTKVLLSLYGPKHEAKATDDLEATEQEQLDIQHHVETVIEGLVGESLDSASVNRLYKHHLYERFLSDHQEHLQEGVAQFTRALLIALQGKPFEADLTPTSTHARVKELVYNICKEADSLPCLRDDRKSVDQKSSSACSDMSESDDGDDVFCDTYEDLLVMAIINKAVEIGQRKYEVKGGAGKCDKACEPDIIRTAKKAELMDVGCQSDIPLSDSGQEEEEFTAEETESDEFLWARVAKQDPFKYIIEEKIEEEITEAYTESEDERNRSAMSECEEHSSSSTDVPFTLDPSREHRVPFPEMGVDIVTPYALNSEGEEEEEERGKGEEGPGSVWTSAVQDWEDNWLFRQKKRSAALGAFRGGRYAAYYDPINMVIPNPSSDDDRVRIGSRDLDELSEMSEKLSVGSLELSSASDSEEEEEEKEPAAVRLYQRSCFSHATKNSPEGFKQTQTRCLRTSIMEICPIRYVPKSVFLELVDKTNQYSVFQEGSSVKTDEEMRRLLRVPEYATPDSRKQSKDPSLRFVSQPEAKTSLHAGKTAKFVCEVTSAKLLGRVAWFRGKERLIPNERCRTTRLRGKEYVLELYDTNKSDEGTYSAVAYTDKDEVWCDFALAVRATSRATNAPDFTVTPHVVEPLGEPCVQLSCTVSGYPEPRVWFLKDDLPLPDSEEDRFSLENKGYGEWCLRVDSPTSEDEAEYVAVARNSLGQKMSRVTFRLADLKLRPDAKPAVGGTERSTKPQIKTSRTPVNVDAEGRSRRFRPLVIQRTWAERQALQPPHWACKPASMDGSLVYDETSSFKSVDEKTEPIPSMEVLNAPPKPGTIAEREHAKWLNAVPLRNNPYSTENLVKRASQSRRESLATAKTSSFEGTADDCEANGDDDAFSPPTLPSSYLRDYYINNPKLVAKVDSTPPRKTTPVVDAQAVENRDLEETLHSFEEQVYSSTRKAFTPTAHQRSFSPLATSSPQLVAQESTSCRASPGAASPDNHDGLGRLCASLDVEDGDGGGLRNPSLPSVRELVLKFASQSAQSAPDDSSSSILERGGLHSPGQEFQSAFPDKKVILEERALNGQEPSAGKDRLAPPKPQEPWSIRKEFATPSQRPQPLPRNSLVHSLTARSLPREFREHAQRNLVPRQMNRTVVASPPSPTSPTNAAVPAPACEQLFQQAPQQQQHEQAGVNTMGGDLTPGYASDESSTSSSLGGGIIATARSPSGGGKRRSKSGSARGILQRTSYWERRVEQGLLSDSSVTEEFPPLHQSRPANATNGANGAKS